MHFGALLVVALILSLDVVRAQSGDDVPEDEVPMTLIFNHAHKDCYLGIKSECEHNGKKYEFLETWMSKDCHHCTCYNEVGVLCCETLKLPIDWPAKCTPRIDKRKCEIRLALLEDPSLPCPTRWTKRLKRRKRRRMRKNRRRMNTQLIVHG